MYGLLDRGLDQVVRTGTLIVTDPRGRPRSYGDGSGEPVRFRLTDRLTPIKVALDSDLYLGEAYMNGGIVLEQGTIYDLLALLLKNIRSRDWPWAMKVLDRARIALMSTLGQTDMIRNGTDAESRSRSAPPRARTPPSSGIRIGVTRPYSGRGAYSISISTSPSTQTARRRTRPGAPAPRSWPVSPLPTAIASVTTIAPVEVR